MKRLQNKIQKNKEKIAALMNQNLDLAYQLNMAGIKKFSESEVNRSSSKKNPIMVKVKWMHWKESFTDESTNEKIWIERRQPVELGGEKSFGWKKLKYYKSDDISL